MVYRFYWVDFYRSELEALNPEEDLALSKGNTILIFGDSFTADPNSWVNTLRDSLEDYNIINSALPGTSVFHQKLFFGDRVDEFHPDQIIIQLFIGNDLIDYNRPQNFKTLSWTRNIYWWLSDQFISLQFVNTRLGRFKKNSDNFQDAKTIDQFHPQKYNSRVQNYVSANPSIFMESVNPSDYFKSEFEELKNDLTSMIGSISSDIKVEIIVVPAAFQTSVTQLENYKKMGATFNDGLMEFSFLKEVQEMEKGFPNVKVWSPISDFQKEPEELYYLNDPHLNPKGQKLLGKLVLQALKCE